MGNILIIGAASQIAQETTKLWAMDGHNLILAGRNLDKLKAIKQDLIVRGAKSIDTLTYEASDYRNTKIIDDVFAKYGTIDICLIAHGVLFDQKDAEDDEDLIEKTYQINLMSYIFILNKLARYLKKQKSGTIAVISSVAGDRGRKSNYIYGSTKAAITSYTSGLRGQLSPYGVHVVTIKPGFVRSPMTEGIDSSPLYVEASVVAQGIVDAVRKRKDIVYLPFFWFFIMSIIKIIPEKIFKRLSF